MSEENFLDFETAPPKPRKGFFIAFALIVLLIIAWFMIRPGVFTIQPIGALPDGISLIYHSRNPEMEFFSSPDGLCLDIQGSVSLLCRMVGLSVVEDLLDRKIINLPLTGLFRIVYGGWKSYAYFFKIWPVSMKQLWILIKRFGRLTT